MATAAYSVLRNLIIDGHPASVGAVVNLSPDEAAPLVDSGDLAAVVVSTPVAQAPDTAGYRAVSPFVLFGHPVFPGDPITFTAADLSLNIPGELLALGLVELV